MRSLHTQGDHIPFRTVTEQGQKAHALRSVFTLGMRPHQQPDPNLVLLPSARTTGVGVGISMHL